MPELIEPNKAAYLRLLETIKREITEGTSRAQEAYNREKIISYWKIGKAISVHLSQSRSVAAYGKHLHARLAGDLGIGERLLYQMTQFYNTYPNLKPSQNLNWSHYRLLTTVKDEGQRNALEAKAASDNWSHRALDTFIKDERSKSPKPKSRKFRKLSVLRRRLYTYNVFKDDYSKNVLIDCGFNIYHESNMGNFRGNFVETVKTKSGYKLAKTTSTYKQLYTYKAYVKKIIDGDTIWVVVDCGFKIWTHQKIRLRGIDAPGITTQKGLESYKFVCKELKGLPFIVIKSHGRDKYDRYLSDIFYLKDEKDPQGVLKRGEFLNQRLLDESLAIHQST